MINVINAYFVLADLVNNTVVDQGIKAFQGNWGAIIGAIVLIAATFFVLFILKNFIANAIVGIIALLFFEYVVGIPIPLSPLVILVSVLGGLGGVAAILLATFFGWI